jgi:hypothetical protein
MGQLQQFISLAISLVILYFVYRAYDYLGNLESCNCAPKVYIERLKWTELAYLVVFLIGIIGTVLGLLFGIELNGIPVALALIYFIGILGLFVFFLYNLYQYIQQLNPSCDCSNQWQNMILYVQALYLGLPIIMMVLGYFLGFSSVPFLVMIAVIVLLIYFYEKFVVETGSSSQSMKESMISRLGIFDNMAMQPDLFSDVCTKNKAIYADADADFSPNVGQPMQRYKQAKPCEAPVPKDGQILTPYATHETIVRGYRNELNY